MSKNVIRDDFDDVSVSGSAFIDINPADKIADTLIKFKSVNEDDKKIVDMMTAMEDKDVDWLEKLCEK
jgi:hypothetical protein